MKYALLIAGDVAAEPVATAFDAFCGRLRADGSFRGARRLSGPEAARTVRATEGGLQVGDGPANEGGEQLGAFVIADVAGESQAMELAREFVDASGGAVEVRQVAAPGEGGPDADREGVQESAAEGLPEFAFLMHVEDEKRPWPGSPAFDDLMERCGRVLTKLQKASAFRGTERLLPAGSAKTVRAVGGRARLLDGPFAEARELIGGFILGECEGMDAAVELAGLLPGAASGAVEVRPTIR